MIVPDEWRATNSSSRKEFEAAKGPFMKALREAHHAEQDLREAWDYANYAEPPTVDPQTNEVVQDGDTHLRGVHYRLETQGSRA